MEDGFALNWDMYPQYEQVEINPNLSTLLITFKDNMADKIIDAFIDSIKEKNYQIKEELIDGEYRQVLINKSNSIYAIVSPMFNFLISRNYLNLGNGFVRYIESHFAEQIKEIVSILHIEQTKELESDLQIKYRSGTNPTKDDLTPYTYFILFQKKEVVGRALLEYFNYEMGDLAPTILMIEVDENQQGLGLGKKFLNFIECEMINLGFSKIWSSDTQNMEFWEKMGYDIDIDEGFKHLDPSECAELM
jgi:GNAT superfamily N-acetyltransferase